MKIDRITNTNVDKIYNSNKRVIEETNKIKYKDAVEISPAAKNISAIKNDSYLDSEQKVSEIKSKIDAGTYKVNIKALVNKFNEVMKGREI